MGIRLKISSTLEVALAAALLLATTGATASAAGRFCSATASAQLAACHNEIRDDFYESKAICTNVSDDEERAECFGDAAGERKEGNQLCSDQRAARGELCDLLGEARYDPEFDAANFDADFDNPTRPNPYYPLTIGNVWEFQAADESNRIEVLDETKLIEGVTCVVVHDLGMKDDGSSEDTDDWYALRKDGSVLYCGEEVKDLEVFAGDVPMDPELVAIDGSFKAGRDGAKPGTIFLADPAAGAAYRQEWSAGNAEDAAIVLSNSYGYGSDLDLDRFVPRALAELLCAANDCVVIAEITPIEPELRDRKYYARGIGNFLEVNVGAGEINRLVDCNFDARCASLPMP
jgi:hypothetical protein